MSRTIVTVTWSNNRATYGYCIDVIKAGKVVFTQNKIASDPCGAAAFALLQKARHGASRIIADSKVMEAIGDE